MREPQSAQEYDARTTAAVKSVLVELGQVLGTYRDRFALIGGSVPWVLIQQPDFPHIGTMDIDLTLDPEALGDGEYAQLIGTLLENGYEQKESLRRFQLVRAVDLGDDGPEIDVQVDFLMPRDVELAKNDPPLVKDFAVQKADGAALALRFKDFVAIEGHMPDGGGRNRVQIAVATIPALLAMKGFAIANRKKAKDAYDIYYCVRNYPGGHEALALACQSILETEEGREGYAHIADKFSSFEQFGPVQVRKFVEGSQALDGRTAEQWQRDAFGQVDAWLREMALGT